MPLLSLIPEEIEEYCELHTTPETPLLNKLNRETNLKVLRPRMLSGKLQGGFLSMISRMLKPSSILEIGTYTGYSALCLAEGLTPTGELHTIEIDEELEDISRKYFELSEHRTKIHLHIGDANEIIPTLNYQWDLVFIDAEKKDYQKYFELIFPNLRSGGIILIDNVLWSGKVVEEVAHNDFDTQAILAFNDFIQQHEGVINLTLPFRDGILMVEKI